METMKSPNTHQGALYELKRLVTEGRKVTMGLKIPTAENPDAVVTIVIQRHPSNSSFTVTHLDGTTYNFGARDLDRICDIDWEIS